MNKNNHAQRLLLSVESELGINKLLALIKALRDPDGGCPWDKQQNYQSILPFTIEEVYEVAEAIENNDFVNLKEELGDLLFQIVFYAQLAQEEERFDFNAIVESICDKLVHRHPHVFSNADYVNQEQLTQAWEDKKQQERNKKSVSQASVLNDIPKALPELKRAQKIQKRVANVGFDWDHIDQVWDKVNEECSEIKEAANTKNKQHIEEELGDLIFSVVNLTRHYGCDADMALRKANLKFEKRFRQLEKLSKKPLQDCSLNEMEDLWQTVKTGDLNK